MAKFVRLKQVNGVQIAVNAEQVIAVEPQKDGMALRFLHHPPIQVEGSFEVVMAALEGQAAHAAAWGGGGDPSGPEPTRPGI